MKNLYFVLYTTSGVTQTAWRARGTVSGFAQARTSARLQMGAAKAPHRLLATSDGRLVPPPQLALQHMLRAQDHRNCADVVWSLPRGLCQQLRKDLRVAGLPRDRACQPLHPEAIVKVPGRCGAGEGRHRSQLRHWQAMTVACRYHLGCVSVRCTRGHASRSGLWRSDLAIGCASLQTGARTQTRSSVLCMAGGGPRRIWKGAAAMMIGSASRIVSVGERHSC